MEHEKQKQALTEKLDTTNQLYRKLAELRTACPTLLKLVHPEIGTSQKFQHKAQEVIASVEGFKKDLAYNQSLFQYVTESLAKNPENLMPTYPPQEKDIIASQTSTEDLEINKDGKQRDPSQTSQVPEKLQDTLNSFGKSISSSNSSISDLQADSFILEVSTGLKFHVSLQPNGDYKALCIFSKFEATMFSVNRYNQFQMPLFLLLPLLLDYSNLYSKPCQICRKVISPIKLELPLVRKYDSENSTNAILTFHYECTLSK
ncbi:mediator complex subunit Pmc3/Med27 [Schizosaccharomyces cryophilus OY26]|uniref:Mediator complex subunit Pmc3/Med27 n=1 Tax=Schizosaccharomyces cryophilus (strain OY26 / ATCC MYA-4695 / CBS 11777 / NBRC 106824 / NRRL Y48691) TaxID=653667 RepID=S9X5P2_SCHCR|nr:mediator complex subunit Pmc3/Med27 [Schizosaccharomyces cryophilus OY26]EPY52357.1 mediator complex subunit Pmc3/Med27 [Schizosaccharomyces cryophilus OY26]